MLGEQLAEHLRELGLGLLVAEGDPEQGDHDVDEPGQLGVFLALRRARDQRHRGSHDHQLLSLIHISEPTRPY